MHIKIISFVYLLIFTLTASANNILDYRIGDNVYAVVYVESEAISRKEARCQAINWAAELAYSNGYRYIVIDTEQDVQVAMVNPPQQPFYGNMYQELIIERGFGRGSITKRSLPSNGGVYPAFKITFTCYNELPMRQGKVIDVSRD